MHHVHSGNFQGCQCLQIKKIKNQKRFAALGHGKQLLLFSQVYTTYTTGWESKETVVLVHIDPNSFHYHWRISELKKKGDLYIFGVVRKDKVLYT